MLYPKWYPVFFLLSFATRCVSKAWSSHRPVHPPPATVSPCACLLWTVQTPHLPQTVLMLALRPRGVQRLPAPAASQKPRVLAWGLAWGLDWALAQEWWWEVTAGEREQRLKLLLEDSSPPWMLCCNSLTVSIQRQRICTTLSVNWSEPRGKGGVEGGRGRETMEFREVGAKGDREGKGKPGKNKSVARKRTKGAGRGKR